MALLEIQKRGEKEIFQTNFKILREVLESLDLPAKIGRGKMSVSLPLQSKRYFNEIM